MNPLYTLLELIAEGKSEQADELFDALLGERVSDILDNARGELAAQLFASTEGEVIEEGNKENKAKKNAHTDKVGAKNSYELLIPDERRAGRVSMSGKYQRGDKPKDTLHAKKSATHGDKKHTSRMSRLALKREKKPNLPESTDLLDEGNKENKAKKREFEKTLTKNVMARRGYMDKNANAVTTGRAIRRSVRSTSMKKIANGEEWISRLKESLQEGNAENKAKKNAYHDSVSTKSLFKSGGTLHNRGLVRRNDAAKRDSDLKANRKKAVYKHIIKKVMAKESVEQLDELSKQTLGSYVSKAASDAFGAGHDAGSGKLGSAKSMKGYEKGTKRLAGIRKATAKLAKEEVEQLDELSKKTLGSYVKKAVEKVRDHTSDSAHAASRFSSAGGYGTLKYGPSPEAKKFAKMSVTHAKQAEKRAKGIGRATDKLSEAMSDEMKAKVKADMEKRRAAKNAALDSAKKEMEGWKPDKKELRKIYKKED